MRDLIRDVINYCPCRWDMDEISLFSIIITENHEKGKTEIKRNLT